MGIYDKITEKLLAGFDPEFLQVLDESERHRGHADWTEGKSTHFRVRIVAKSLAGLGRIDRQRAIMEPLKDEFAAGLHALAIEVLDEAPASTQKGRPQQQ